MKSKSFKRILISLLLAAVAAVSAVSAEGTDAFTEFPEALGGFYGEVSGQGLSYQKWYGKVGLQAAFGLLYDDFANNHSTENYSPGSELNELFSYNAGVELMYRVYSDTYQDWFDGCLYVFAGVMHTGRFSMSHNYSTTAVDESYPYINTTGPFYKPYFSPGFGIGFEPVLFNHFSMPFELALMGSWGIDSFMPVDAGLKVQGGLRYRY